MLRLCIDWLYRSESRAVALRFEKKGQTGDDTRVIEAVLGGDVDAFEVLLRRYSAEVFALIARRVPGSELESVAQETFISAYQSLANYRAREPFLHWLLTIASRRCYDYWRSHKTLPTGKQDDLPLEHQRWLERVGRQSARAVFLRTCQQQEAADLVYRALDGLNAEDRTLITILYFEEETLEDAAATLGWSYAKTKVRAYRARRRLRNIIEKMTQTGSSI